MTKRKPKPRDKQALPAESHSLEIEFGRGEIKDNALKALVTSPVFRTRVVKSKKGKGSYRRQNKHKGKSPFQSQLSQWIVKWAFFIVSDQRFATQ